MTSLCGLLAICSQAFAQSAGSQVRFDWDVKIPMRDGVELSATVFRPRGPVMPLPVIVTMTPYGSDNYQDRALYFSQHGYVYVTIDVRGRGNSEGKFTPLKREAEDGHDVIEWLAIRPWSNGKVAMWGGSYAGYNQWAAAKEFPPHLTTIVPAAAAFPGVDIPFWRNIYSLYEFQWQTYVSGVANNGKLMSLSEFWIPAFRTLYEEHRPFIDLPEITGSPLNSRTWMEHPHPDAYWDSMVPTSEEFARINLPILTITGHYDVDQPGAMEFYNHHMTFGSRKAKRQHHLIVGPWDHSGTRTPRKDVGGLSFGEASVLDLNDLHRQWYNWTMKGGPKPEFLGKRVAYFVTGAEIWKFADSLEDIGATPKRLYLRSNNGQANDVFHSGTLAETATDTQPDTYSLDPLDVRPAELESQIVENYLTDQRASLNLFGNGLVYHSEPFSEDTEITGKLKLVAWVAIDVPDTDFEVLVSEVLPDGNVVHLTQDRMRARYRESLRVPRLVEAGKVNKYEFDGFYFISRMIGKGSRLRMIFKNVNSILLEKNYNSGGVVNEESGANAQTVRVTLYHDVEHASYLEMPVVPH